MSEHTKGEMQGYTKFPGILHINGVSILCVFPNHCDTVEDIELRKANTRRVKLCWNSHDTLTKQRDDLLKACDKTRDRLIFICVKGGTLQGFIDDGGLIEIVDASMAVDKANSAIAACKKERKKMKIKNVEVSEETIVGWAKKAGVTFDKPTPKFKPVLCHCLEVSVRGQYVVVRTIRDDFDNDTGCTQEPEDARRMARTLLDAAASVEANK